MFCDTIVRAAESFLPSQLRFGMQRLRARRARDRFAASWPICERYGKSPEGWPGWPDGKEFAFTLTHDVLGPSGLSRCKEVAEIEMEHGFRSSFHFLTDCRYEVPADLLDWLRRNGFEVGIRHPDRNAVFGSSRLSQDQIRITNRQLAVWGARGFRASNLCGNLDRLHDLEIDYDASTRDFDPFGWGHTSVQTVFPFWVAKTESLTNSIAEKNGHGILTRNGAVNGRLRQVRREGYIEIPSTMPTDRDLFLILGENGIGIWLQKLRWLVEKGGLAMLNTQPDCMTTSLEPTQTSEYPVKFYNDFLAHARKEYENRYWSILPHEVATYCRKFRPGQARPARRVVMLSHSFYKYDNRVRRYAETLARRGDHVTVFCMGPEEQVRSKKSEVLNDVVIRPLQYRPPRAVSKWTHAVRLIRFFWRAQLLLKPRNLPGGCDLLHVHNVPDFLAFAGWRFKLKGTPIILDIHDLVPELFQSKFQNGQVSVIPTVLRQVERWSCKFCNHIIVANHLWKRTLVERSAEQSKVTALLNYVDLDLFRRMPRKRTSDRIVLLYPGSLHHHQGIDLAIDAVKALSREIPNLDLHIHGNGAKMPELEQQIRSLGLTERVRFFSTVPLHEVPALMADADIGIVPKRAHGFGGQAYSTKIMEFMSQALPVVLSRTPIDSMYFDESVVAYFESGNSEDLARAIRRVVSDPHYRDRLSREGLAYAKANSWQKMNSVYLNLVDRLTMTAVV